jgi:hypothetical protein
MRIDAVACGISDLNRHSIELSDFGIGDLVASGTNQMRMGIGPVAIVPVASINETDLEDFADLFEQIDCFINRRQAGRGEIHFDFFIDLLNTRVILALKKGLEDSYALRCDAEFALAQLGQDFIQSLLNIVHLAFPVYYNLRKIIVY